MSDSALPEDMSQWPDDPYRILDVGRDVDARGAKRAYHRLIRRFKPEHFPDQFRRIREAYEWVQMEIERQAWMAQMEAQGTVEEDGERGSPAGVGSSSDVIEEGERSAASEGELPLIHHRPRLETIWRDAMRGRMPEAYSGLHALLREDSSSDEVYGRLYWLLRLAPELDPSRGAVDWLVEGLSASGLSRPLVELYRREMVREPEETMRERCRRLVRTRAHPELLADFVCARWMALRSDEQLRTILDDLYLLRERPEISTDSQWSRLLVTAVERLVWSEADDLREAVGRFVSELEDALRLDDPYAAELDRLELLLETASGYHKCVRAPGPPRSLLVLVPRSFQEPYESVRPALMRALEEMSLDPYVTMERFDGLFHLNQAVAVQLGTLILHSWREEAGAGEEELDRTAIAAIHEFAKLHSGRAYEEVRGPLLRFALRHAVAPDQIADIISRFPYFELAEGMGWTDAIHSDGSLVYTWAACYAFWG